MALGQGQEMTLTFNTHICSFFSVGFRSQAAIVLKNQQFFNFSYRKAIVTKFDIAVK